MLIIVDITQLVDIYIYMYMANINSYRWNAEMQRYRVQYKLKHGRYYTGGSFEWTLWAGGYEANLTIELCLPFSGMP